MKNIKQNTCISHGKIFFEVWFMEYIKNKLCLLRFIPSINPEYIDNMF